MIAIAALALGALISSINFYTSFLRKPLARRLNPIEPYRAVTGFPVIGTVLLGVACWLLPSGSPLVWAAVLLIALDTGGPHWFLLALLKQR